VGTPEGLLALRDALTRALETKEPAVAKSFVNDGEGYSIVIVPQSDLQMGELMAPYTDPYGARPGEVFDPLPGKHPFETVSAGTYIALVKPT
jgi:hypothetical protein